MGPGIKEFTAKLSNCTLTKLQVDSDHYYYLDGAYAVSVTQILDIGAPSPEGLLEWFKNKSPEEIQERMIMTRDRGSKLHHALESLVMGIELHLEDYPTTYEKAAIVTFIRCMRFLVKYGNLNLSKLKSEYTVGDTKLVVGGTVDLFARADKRAIDILCNPTYAIKLDGDDFILVKPLQGKKKMINFLTDFKFTGRTAYNHKVQAMQYKTMHNQSYTAQKASQAYTWRYSTHKFGFDMEDAAVHLKQKITAHSFKRIYDTALEFIGGYPKAPTIVAYPERVRLWEKKVNKVEGELV